MKNLIRVRVEYTPAIDPFSMCGVRELARRTGLDYSYLAKVRRGVYSIDESRFKKIFEAAHEYRKALKEELLP